MMSVLNVSMYARVSTVSDLPDFMAPGRTRVSISYRPVQQISSRTYAATVSIAASSSQDIVYTCDTLYSRHSIELLTIAASVDQPFRVRLYANNVLVLDQIRFGSAVFPAALFPSLYVLGGQQYKVTITNLYSSTVTYYIALLMTCIG